MSSIFLFFTKNTLNRYDKFLDQNMDYISVDGDHFSMLKGKSAKLISEIISAITANREEYDVP